jgi:hypothetical protein
LAPQTQLRLLAAAELSKEMAGFDSMKVSAFHSLTPMAMAK